MRKFLILTTIVLPLLMAVGCNSKRRTQRRVYMPDMAYSRAYETYLEPATQLDSMGIHYDRMPVPGTIKRGELFPFPIPHDKDADTTNYVLSKQVVNPLASINEVQMIEAQRLYLVNCGICHGAKLDGNGPLYNNGNGPFAAAPKNLVDDPLVSVMPDGQMFYSMTYGKGAMGSYASQLSTTQRWMVIDFIKSKRKNKGGGGVAAASDSTAKKDSATKK